MGQHRTKKRFGQHFLHDQGILGRILFAADVRQADQILEIGPGQGVLTERLLATGAQITVVEIDQDLIGPLQKRFGHHENFRLVEGDVLQLDWAELLGPGPHKLVANLPYNISTPLFFKLLKERERFVSMVVMVQKEVAQRLLHQGYSKPLKDYGVLSVAAQLGFKTESVCSVPPGAFSPPPQVESSVIRLSPKPLSSLDEEAFLAFVRWGFNQRRKLLKTRLRKERPELILSPEWAERLENLRPENLNPAEWVELFQASSGDRETC